MEALAYQVIPLSLSTALLSPVVFALTLIVLGQKKNALKNAFALFLGIAVVATLTVILSVALGGVAKRSGGIGAALDLIAGCVFLAFVIRYIFKPQAITQKSARPFGWFLISLFLELTNFGAILISLNAAEKIWLANVSIAGKTSLLIFNVICFTLPALLPLLLYWLFPKSAHKLLAPLSRWATKNLRMIVVVLFGIFGLIFIYKGLGEILGIGS